LSTLGDPVTLRGATTLSRAGNWFGVFALVWFFGFLVIADYISTWFVPREMRPRWASYLIIAVAALPGIVAMFPGVIGRRRGFRWLLAWPQPEATLDDAGIEVCLPDRGCQHFRWEEIGRFVPAQLTWRERWTRTVPIPRFNLCAPDGSILATLPPSLVVPAKNSRAGRLGDPGTLAQLVVARRPSRFGLLKSGTMMGRFLAFGPVAEAPPQWEIDSAARGHATRRRLIIGVLLALTITGWVIILASRASP
jgi:hypothetical protein